MKKTILLAGLFLASLATITAQNINSENVDIQMLQAPKNALPEASRNYAVTVTSPYNVTKDDIIRKAKEDHQQALNNYDKNVANSQQEFQQKLKDYDADVKKAKDKYEFESAEFKKLSLLERLTMTDQGKNPRLVLPNKPEYIKPYPPVYQEPNLNDYIIVDNNVLASQINIEGLKKAGNYLSVVVDIQKANFQDNAGQSYVNQPLTIVIKENGVEKSKNTYFTEFEFLSSVPTNNINKPLEEKRYLTKVMAFVNQYLNEQYGYTPLKKTVKLQTVKNKGAYDELEKAHIYVTTNLKKIQPDPDPEANAVAFTNMQKGIDIWLATLAKIEYKNSKADFNAKIAKYIFFNLMRLNLALDKKAEAEKYLNQLQENLIYIDLGNDEKRELDELEKQIYKKTK